MKKIDKFVKKWGIHMLLIPLFIFLSTIYLNQNKILVSAQNKKHNVDKSGLEKVIKGDATNSDKENEGEKKVDSIIKPKTNIKSSSKVVASESISHVKVQQNETSVESTQNEKEPKPSSDGSPVVAPIEEHGPVLKTASIAITGLGTFNKVAIKDGDTAMDVLRKVANENGFIIKYKKYSFGIMITAIGGKKAKGTYYWALYYNGSYSNVGASELKILNNDTIEWRYESWK